MTGATDDNDVMAKTSSSQSNEDDIASAKKEYETYMEVRRQAKRSFWNRAVFSLFLGICMMTDFWKVLHNFFPETVPNYEHTFTDTIRSLSSVTVDRYSPKQHHDFEDFKETLSPAGYNYLKDSYEKNSIVDPIKFDSLSGINFTDTLEEVKEAIKHSWKGYKTKGWGYDSVKPVSGNGVNDFSGLAMTLIDSIDTLYLVGMFDEIEEIKNWIVENYRLETQQNVNIFEMNIRILGGLLSAYHLTKDNDFLVFSEYVASKVIRGFVEPSGIPYGIISFGDTISLKNTLWSKSCTSIAEAGTLSLELDYISRISDKVDYSKLIERLNKKFHKLVFTTMDRDFADQGNADLLRSGLLPSYIEPIAASFAPCTSHQKYSFGGGIDSVYEYFLKLNIVKGNKNKKLRELYLASIEGGMKHLLRVTKGKKRFVYFGEQSITPSGNTFLKNMDHLACYLPGMIALGVHHNITQGELSVVHMNLAKHVMRTCYNAYKVTKTGLAPESIAFSRVSKNIELEISPKVGSKHTFNRPETVESLYIMYKVTDDPIYKLWALNIFKAIQKHSKVPFGYSGVRDVDVSSTTVTHNDRMESFFISETLKYLFLIFNDEDIFPLDKYIFNTEAHPFPIYGE